MERIRNATTGLLAASFLLVAGCASAPAEPPLPDLAGTWSGSINIQGQTLFGNMTVVQEGPALELRFSLPDIALTASGEGSATETGFRGEVPYTLNCPGVAVFTGSLDDEQTVLTGRVEATDCDGTANGTFRFTRRG